jgi:DNA-binding winged helix-turn-helix (wHTH) protein
MDQLDARALDQHSPQTSALVLAFDCFTLDLANRRLCRDGSPIELNSRYFDALALLLREPGLLISKARLHDEVWRGVTVGDEALTQAIKAIRRALGDKAESPRFIETVPKHGYRFIAPVHTVTRHAATSAPRTAQVSRATSPMSLWAGGCVGAATSGLIGGTLYGLVLALASDGTGMGATSSLMVFIVITALVAIAAGASVSLSIAAAVNRGAPAWLIVVAGAGAGFLIGAIAKLIGSDVIKLLFGVAPALMTGAGEGLMIGAAVGLGVAAGVRGKHRPTVAKGIMVGATAGGLVGVLLPLAGGTLLGGSLVEIANHFPASHIKINELGQMFGERGFGPLSQMITGFFEVVLFVALTVGGILTGHTLMEQREPEH